MAAPKTIPRLIEAQSNLPGSPAPNVLLISGLPWYCTESHVMDYLKSIYPDVQPITTRLYCYPHNGASRGVCFVEYPALLSEEAAQRPYNVTPPLRLPMTVSTNLAALQRGPTPPTVDWALIQHHITANWFDQNIPLTAALYHMTYDQWDRSGALPPLPTDPPPVRMLLGYGDEGRAVRCGSHVETANTISSEGLSRLERSRKRLRAAQEKQAHAA